MRLSEFVWWVSGIAVVTVVVAVGAAVKVLLDEGFLPDV